MTWTYSGDPSASDKDNVRFMIGDTDTTEQLVTDEEITATVTQFGTAYRTALALCDRLIAKFSRLVDSKFEGEGEFKFSQLVTNIKAIKEGLILQGDPSSGGGPIPYAGGLSIADKDAQEDDTSRVTPMAYRDLHANPEALRTQESELLDP